jgi:surfactin synthase thioesterase subunit
MPEEILQSEELLNYLEPILRSDFKVSETYKYEGHEPLDIPMTVITGTEEEMDQEDILLWQKESRQEVDFRQMPGGHFFILEHTSQIVEIITNKLLSKHTQNTNIKIL